MLRYSFLLIILSLFNFSLSNSNIDDKSFHLIEFRGDFNNLSKLYNEIQNIYNEIEDNVKFEFIMTISQFDEIVHLEPIEKDLTCLLLPPSTRNRNENIYYGDIKLDLLVDWINKEINSFRLINGELSNLGNHFLNIKNNQYFLSNNNLNNNKCDRITFSDLNSNTSLFYYEYWLKQKPLIIENINIGSKEFILNILSKYLSTIVGVKLSPSIEYEGVEPLTQWKMSKDQYIPFEVLEQLESPDMVVVRASHQEMKLGEILQLISTSSNNINSSSSNIITEDDIVNAYIEYLDLRPFPELYDDLVSNPLPTWLNDLVLEGIPYMWLGDGRTVGKLHFDPFDNLLVQIEGKKTFHVMDPTQNERLYEGHIREAEIEYKKDKNTKKYKFYREKLSKTTSMVHSPLYMNNLNKTRYSLSKDLPTFMDCTLNKGDAIWLPSYWWHEVNSKPSDNLPIPSSISKLFNSNNKFIKNTQYSINSNNDYNMKLNVALNWWFAPLFTKDFPCSSCRKKINNKYRHILEREFSNV
jgi:jumonji domain-containing protein 7